MRYRIFFVLVTAFFVTMNVLLWRSEFGARNHLGTPVPADVVWEKVLTSPDQSHLEIRHHGVKTGHARWVSSIREESGPDHGFSDEPPPDGMVKVPTGYNIDFEAALVLEDLSRLRVTFSLTLDQRQEWQDLTLRLTVKPFVWEVRASVPKQEVRFVTDDDEEHKEQKYSFAELRNPQKLLAEFGGPELPAALAAFGFTTLKPGPSNSPPTLAGLGLKWEARNDRLKISNNFVRVYRLEARLFDRFKAIFFVSPVGELLRVELPDEIIMMNDAVTSL